jgi:hypothetical protein
MGDFFKSPETRGIRVTIKGDGDKPAPESVTIISSNARSQFTGKTTNLKDNKSL